MFAPLTYLLGVEDELAARLQQRPSSCITPVQQMRKTPFINASTQRHDFFLTVAIESFPVLVSSYCD